ncbi:MAG TPA: protein phosphatase CheZ [Alphaproteobacteria bacterium]|jgi:chemotaxis protein CheZ|nr:protein phosphatase CheZ [Alphaproteobacteria bacterium]
MSGIVDQNRLAQQLIDLQKAEPGTVRLEDVSAVVAGIMDAARKEMASSDNEVVAKMIGLADYIENAKADIAALRPDEVTERHLPAAADELDEIVAETADATNRIMDATETIQGAIGDVDEATQETIFSASNQIFEACSFQDITGQRVTKVVKALKEIEEKVDSLILAFGDEIDEYKARHVAEAEATDAAEDAPVDFDDIPDEALLQGPQLSDEAMSQDDIDKLLNSA